MNVSELEGIALDWAVAKCEPDSTLEIYFDNETGEPLCHDDWSDNQEFRPSTDWAQGGPIIQREELSRLKCYGTNQWECNNGPIFCEGPTPLIAAMRCYVASKLGEEIDVPEALLNQKGER
jgi:hypothetical protein